MIMKTYSPSIFTLLLLLFSLPVAQAQTSLVVQPGTPTLDGEISAGEWTSSTLVTARGVSIQAMADGDNLYLAATWSDDTENNASNILTFDGTQWSAANDEDRIAFLFDMGETGADGANCQAFCHFPNMSTNGGTVDVWNWKAAQTNPMGYSEDTYWDASGQHVDEGVTAVLVNELDGAGLPGFMASSDPGAIKDYLVENMDAMNAFDPYNVLSGSVEEAVSFNSGATFSANDYVSGYVYRIPSGDFADVRAAGKYDNGTWTVEFSRKYEGGDRDFTVVPGESVKFVHEVFDNQGTTHALDATPIDGVSYTLDFSTIPTAIESVDSEVPAAFTLSQNYPNPFNPTTTIDFNLPNASNVTLRITNLLGQVVATPIQQSFAPGNYRYTFEASSLPSGTYIYTLTTDEASISRQMSLLK